MRSKIHFALVFSAFSAVSAVNAVQAQTTMSADSAAAAKTVDDYHAALSSGDSAKALSLLAPDAVILESGGMETRAEYRSHHLAGDIAFAKTVKSERSPLVVRIDGNTAWTSSTSVTQGTFNGRAINSSGAESMVLTKGPDGWRIRAIHWSSRTRRAPAT
jgi:ketosteroid isomerase-like protein